MGCRDVAADEEVDKVRAPTMFTEIFVRTGTDSSALSLVLYAIILAPYDRACRCASLKYVAAQSSDGPAKGTNRLPSLQ